MTAEMLTQSAQGAAASACAAVGLSLLAGRNAAVLVRLLALGAAVVLWLALWLALAPLTGVVAAWVGPEAPGWLGVGALNLVTAVLAWLPAWLALRRLAPRAAVPRLAEAMAGLVFFAGLLLPWLGQDGAWPGESVLLALCCAALAALMHGRRPRREA